MSTESRRLAGILLITLPTVVFGGASLLRMLVNEPAYMDNPLRQDLWRAGHAHAGIMLILSLILLRYVDEANLSEQLKSLVRYTIPSAAILMPLAFFLSVLEADATEPNALIYLAYLGGVLVGLGVFTLGWGLIRTPRET